MEYLQVVTSCLQHVNNLPVETRLQFPKTVNYSFLYKCSCKLLSVFNSLQALVNEVFLHSAMHSNLNLTLKNNYASACIYNSYSVLVYRHSINLTYTVEPR